MITRRRGLSGTAAASIAAIATADAKAAPASDSNGFDMGFGALESGAIGGFFKSPDNSYRFFLKWAGAGVELFLKDNVSGKVDVFQKSFIKGWSQITQVPNTEGFSIPGPLAITSDAHFQKIDTKSGKFAWTSQYDGNQYSVDITLQEEVSFNFIKIKIEYPPQNSTG